MLLMASEESLRVVDGGFNGGFGGVVRARDDWWVCAFWLCFLLL